MFVPEGYVCLLCWNAFCCVSPIHTVMSAFSSDSDAHQRLGSEGGLIKSFWLPWSVNVIHGKLRKFKYFWSRYGGFDMKSLSG